MNKFYNNNNRKMNEIWRIRFTWTVLEKRETTRLRMSLGTRSAKLASSSWSGPVRHRLNLSLAKCWSEAIRLGETHATWTVHPVATKRRRSLCPQVKLVIGAYLFSIPHQSKRKRTWLRRGWNTILMAVIKKKPSVTQFQISFPEKVFTTLFIIITIIW